MDGGSRSFRNVRIAPNGGRFEPQSVFAPSSDNRRIDPAEYGSTSVFLILPGADPGWLARLAAFATEDYFGERKIVVVGNDPFDRAPDAVRKRCIWISSGFSERAALAFSVGVSGVTFDADAFARIEFPDDVAMRLAVRTFEDVDRYGRILAAMFGLSTQVSIGVCEMLINAVEHGNLEISSVEKTRLLDDGIYFEEILRRLDSSRYADRFALLHVHGKDGLLRLRIVDCGQGFDWRSIVGRELTASTSRHLRGIALAKAAGFSTFSYVGNGNEVILEVPFGS